MTGVVKPTTKSPALPGPIEMNTPTKKRYQMAYAYTVSCYAEFTVEADSEDEAERIAQNNMDKLDLHLSDEAEADWDTAGDTRVFCVGEVGPSDWRPKLEEMK